ncbi:hypothetical protein BHM03_00040029 [Ensete ventricosum]|nr:hypothetical protein BHM03_00040029 [Ensete ventricosum]
MGSGRRIREVSPAPPASQGTLCLSIRGLIDQAMKAMIWGRKTEEDLLEAIRVQAMEEYKVTAGFKLELQRTGQVSYEYGYQVALA